VFGRFHYALFNFDHDRLFDGSVLEYFPQCSSFTTADNHDTAGMVVGEQCRVDHKASW
jgi:hypothetical protein